MGFVLGFELDGELVKIRPRANFTEIYTEAETPSAIYQVSLKFSIHEVARKFNGGWDVCFLECEWRAMLQGKEAIPETRIIHRLCEVVCREVWAGE